MIQEGVSAWLEKVGPGIGVAVSHVGSETDLHVLQ